MKIALVASSGGHLTEVMQILHAFSGHEVFFVTYTGTGDDELTKIARTYFCGNVVKRPANFIATIARSLIILIKEKPEVVFSTGSEIAMPFFLWAKLLGIRTFFLETWSAVERLSITGRFVYRLADVFWVQWQELLPSCGEKVEFHGAVI
jgi:beta-1,4-N-acetylglucosaminyltransferase